MKVLAILTFTFLALNVTHAGQAEYGEDLKGECKNGKGSTRGQEELIVSSGPEVEVRKKEVNSK